MKIVFKGVHPNCDMYIVVHNIKLPVPHLAESPQPTESQNGCSKYVINGLVIAALLSSLVNTMPLRADRENEKCLLKADAHCEPFQIVLFFYEILPNISNKKTGLKLGDIKLVKSQRTETYTE